MKATLQDLLQQLRTSSQPTGSKEVSAFSHGTMSLLAVAPGTTEGEVRRDQDAIYIIAAGRSEILLGDESVGLEAGDAVFVGSGQEHRFTSGSDDLVVWAMLWGPAGGEAPAPTLSVFAAIDA